MLVTKLMQLFNQKQSEGSVAQEFIECIEGVKKSHLTEFNYLGYGSLPAIKEKSVEALTGEYGLANQAGNAYFQTSGFVDAARKVGLSESLIGKIQSAGNRLNLNETLDVATAMLRDASSNNQVNWETDILGSNGFISKLEGFGLDANLAHSGLQFVKESMSQQGGCSFTLDANEWNTDLVHQLAVEMTEREWENIPSSPRRLPMTEAPIRDDMAWMQQATGAIPAWVNLNAGGGANAGGAGNGVAKAEAVTAAPMKVRASTAEASSFNGEVISTKDFEAVSGHNGWPFLSSFSKEKVSVENGMRTISYENGVGGEIKSLTLKEIANANGRDSVMGTYTFKIKTMGPEKESGGSAAMKLNKGTVGGWFLYSEGLNKLLGKQGQELDFEQGIVDGVEYLTANAFERGKPEQSDAMSRSIKITPGQEVEVRIVLAEGRAQLQANSDGQWFTLLDKRSGMLTENNVGLMAVHSNLWHRSWGDQTNNQALAKIGMGDIQYSPPA